MRLIVFLIFLSFHLSAQNWQTIGTWNNSVTLLYTDTVSDRLIIGGSFRLVDEDTMSGVSQWDGHQLIRMGCGIEWDCSPTDHINNGRRPWDIRRFNNRIFAVGNFVETSGLQSSGIAYWENSQWNAIENGLYRNNGSNGLGMGLANIDDELFVLGGFDSCSNVFARSVSKFNETEGFSSIGFPNYVDGQSLKCAAKFQGVSYFAGLFNNATNLNNGDIWNIVKYENEQWQPVGQGIRGGMSGVEKMVVFQDKLYVAGVMSKAAGAPGNAIASWDGLQWDDVGGGLYQQAEAHIYDMKVYNDKLYVVGTFSAAGGIPVNELAVWDGVNWCRVEMDVQDHLTVIRTIEFYNDTLFLGGAFYDYENNIVTNKLLKRLTPLENVQCGNLTSVEQLKTEQIILFPNPTNGLVNLSFVKPVKGEIVLNNLMGQILINESVKGETTTLDLSNFSSGIYFLTFVDESGNVATEKLVVE